MVEKKDNAVKKILIPLISFGKAGGYRTLSQLANYWMKLGIEVDFILPIESVPYFPTKGNILFTNEKGQNIKKETSICHVSFRKKIVGLVKYIRNHASEYDIILASHYITSYLVAAGCKDKGFYYIQAYEPEFFDKKNIRDFVERWLAKLSYRMKLTRIVNADIYRSYNELKSEYVIPPGMDLNMYYPQINLWDKKRPLVVGCIGRVEEWKGSGDVAKAIKILQNKGANIHFKVAFNEVDCEKYELVKPDGDENLSAYYRSVDVLVAPAKLQLGAIHYPVIEAMASGTTVITTGYYPANVDNSYIVPISAPEAIASAIERIMNNYDEAVEKTNRALNEIQRFSWDVVSSDFLKIFEKELNDRNEHNA